MTTAKSAQTTTIHEFLAANPDEDVRESFEQCWGVLTEIRDRLLAEFPTDRHPNSEPYDYYQPGGGWEGSLNTYSGPELEWFVHSWLGNREKSILDMNINIWLGQRTDVPHFVIVFGTIPQLFHYSDFIARRPLAFNPDYVNKYYEPENAHFLEFRGDPRFTWSVSHGTFMRSLLSPVAHSYTAERTPETIEAVRGYVLGRFERWLEMVKTADELTPDQQADLKRDDHFLREHTYKGDPMNKLAENFMGAETVAKMVDLRYGKVQIEASK